MNSNDFQSTNINSLWLTNIYENIKNLENMERMAKEGCSSLMEYLQIPYDHREQIMCDVQLKNLRLMATEIALLVDDLTPVIGKTQADQSAERINRLINALNESRSLFVHEPYSQVKKKIMNPKLKPLFWETLDFIIKTKRELIADIAHLLYVKKEEAATSKPIR